MIPVLRKKWDGNLRIQKIQSHLLALRINDHEI